MNDDTLGRKPGQKKRKVLKNKDGTVSSEESITIQDRGTFLNLPTILGGRRNSEVNAIQKAKRGGWIDRDTGERLKRFMTEVEAVKEAKRRSKVLGRGH